MADTDPIRFTRYPSSPRLLEGLQDHEPVARLQWFTHGIYSVSQADGAVVITDLRMGSEPDYIFRFIVGRVPAGGTKAAPIVPESFGTTPPLDVLPRIWARIWDQRAGL